MYPLRLMGCGLMAKGMNDMGYSGGERRRILGSSKFTYILAAGLLITGCVVLYLFPNVYGDHDPLKIALGILCIANAFIALISALTANRLPTLSNVFGGISLGVMIVILVIAFVMN